MKKIITLIGVAALLATISASAQNGAPAYTPQTIGLPSVIPVANSPTNFPSPFLIDCKKFQNVAFEFVVASKDGSSTTNVTFKGAWSVSGSNFDTNNTVTLTANMLAGIPCTTATNTQASNGRGYFEIYSESIGANSQVTNLSGVYGIKLSAP